MKERRQKKKSLLLWSLGGGEETKQKSQHTVLKGECYRENSERIGSMRSMISYLSREDLTEKVIFKLNSKKLKEADIRYLRGKYSRETGKGQRA